MRVHDPAVQSLPELHTFEERMARRQNRDRALIALAVLILAGTIAGILIATHSGSGPRTTAPSRQPGPATPPTGNPPNASAPATPGSPADMTTMQFQGATVPVSSSSGPFRIAGDLASGFAETPLGSALAAVHISARTNPDAGPAVFQPTISSQVVGDTAVFLSSVTSQYQADAAQAGVASGAPVTHGTPGEVMGYKIDGYSVTMPTTVHLLAGQPGTALLVDIPVTVTWTDGDWKLVQPPAGQFSGSRVTSSVGYTTF